ncbi:MAG: hypothetical protein MJE12_03750 [Alphaproteobacteria bacterium]|nr:hypothetical protein [Alphaproteobacteria bacterium]
MTAKDAEGDDKLRVIRDVWVEIEHGVKAIAGVCSGLADREPEQSNPDRLRSSASDQPLYRYRAGPFDVVRVNAGPVAYPPTVRYT